MEHLISLRNSFIKQQIIFVALSGILIYTLKLQSSSMMLLVVSIWNCLTFGLHFFREIKKTDGFSPLLVLFVTIVQFSGFNGISVSLDMMAGELPYYGVLPVYEVITEGAWFITIEHLLFIVGFWLCEKKYKYRNNEFNNVPNSSIDFYRKAIRVYILVWCLRVVDGILPLSSISYMLTAFASKGHMVTLLLLTFEAIKHPYKANTMKVHWLIVAVEVVLVLGHGMKEEIIQCILPYVIYQIALYQQGNIKLNMSMIARICFIGALTVYFVFPFVACFRNYATQNDLDWSEVSVSSAWGEYVRYINKEGVYANADENLSTDYLMNRAGKIGSTAAGLYLCHQNGPNYDYAKFACISIIPRVLWPSKPQVLLGAMLTKAQRGDTKSSYADLQDEKSSDTFGFIGTCYYALGLIPSLFIPLIMGLILGFVWVMVKRRVSYSALALWIMFVIIRIFSQDLGGFYDLGISGVFSFAVYMVLLKYFAPLKVKS